MPETSSEDQATAVIKGLIHKLKNPKPTALVLGLGRGTPANSAFWTLQEFFKNRGMNQYQDVNHISNLTYSATSRAAQSTAQAPPRVSESNQLPQRVPSRHDQIPRVANPLTSRTTRNHSATTRPITRRHTRQQDQEAQKTHFSNYAGGWGNTLQAILYKEVKKNQGKRTLLI